jgi:hypothetical protein
MERVVLNALGKQVRLCRLIFLIFASSASCLPIVFSRVRVKLSRAKGKPIQPYSNLRRLLRMRDSVVHFQPLECCRRRGIDLTGVFRNELAKMQTKFRIH